MPSFIAMFLFFCLSNISFPTTAGFVPEMLIYFSSLKISYVVTAFVTLVILSLPFYFIWNLHKIGYGKFSNYLQLSYSDLTLKELHIFG
jgi:NADH:ubiquinone oxidoreductase subunit 4 (subunit M)